jgi:hypothetical protein
MRRRKIIRLEDSARLIEESGVASPKGCRLYEASPVRAKGFNEIGPITLDWIREA